jgi:glucose/arabinose dehydrogenase/mono/diheme cytochrome c family protein
MTPVRAILPLCLLFPACVLHAQIGDRSEVDRSAPPEHWAKPDGRVRTPGQTVALFDLPAGFRAEVVAADPLVQDPVAIQFDERGRLWVLEWPSYNWNLRQLLPGLEKTDPPKSRVVILEDTNGDGRMNRRTVFMDDIDWPRGLQVMRDGALVLKLPDLVFARDTNGDGRADQETHLVGGLEIPANPHAAQSNLLRGLDNWIHGSKFPQRLRETPEGWVSMPSLSNRGQWGLSQDNYGRLVYASNGDHLRGDLLPAHYFTRNPNFPVPAGVDVQYPVDKYTWPQGATPGVNRRAQLRDDDGTLQVFTANTGPTVYRGDQFPPEYVGDVFLGEVAGRFVRRSVLTEQDGTITARNAYSRREFLFSRDERFRPVYTANGPDGALYIADMYRGIIEGEIFVTSFLRRQILGRELHQPFNGMGRIYRIIHEERPRQVPPVLAREDFDGWVERLAHPNGFWRDTAQRILVEAGARRVLPALRKMALEHPGELARLHALWTIEGLGAMDPVLAGQALRDSSSKIRVAAIRLSEPWLANDKVASDVIALAADERIEVRRQVLLSLGEGRGPRIDGTFVALLRRDVDQPFTVEIALSGLHNRELELMERLLGSPDWRNESPGAARLYSALGRAILDSGNDPQLERLLGRLAESVPLRWATLAVLDGLKAAQRKTLPRLPATLAALETSGDDAVRTRVAALKKTWSAPPAAKAEQILSGPIFEKGRQLYAMCGACHGPEGQGVAGLAPPLDGSRVVRDAPDELVRSILNGRNLNRANPAFPDMPALAGLPDEDIAAVASYVRARWAGAARHISVGQVRLARAMAAAAESEPAAPPARE